MGTLCIERFVMLFDGYIGSIILFAELIDGILVTQILLENSTSSALIPFLLENIHRKCYFAMKHLLRSREAKFDNPQRL